MARLLRKKNSFFRKKSGINRKELNKENLKIIAVSLKLGISLITMAAYWSLNSFKTKLKRKQNICNHRLYPAVHSRFENLFFDKNR